MKFRFTEEQRMLQESAERFLLEHSSTAVARAAATLPAGLDLPLWQQITSTLGWQAVVVPEDQDGLGLGVVELAILLEQSGARLSPVPLHASAISALALRAAPASPARDGLLQAIASGEIVSLAHTDARPYWDDRGVDLRATQANDKWCLNGAARFVSGGAAAAHLLVVARVDSAIGLFVVPADYAGVSVQHQVTLDQTRSMAKVTLSDVTLDGDAALALDWGRGLSTTLDLARILVAAEQVGCAQRALDMTLEYVAERVQFGRTIASFQAVKHKAADMMLKVESARSLMLYAACTADAWLRLSVDDTALREAAAMVASSAGDAAFFVTGTGIQLHGGVGITEEYDMQLYFKRARALESYLGRPDESRETIAQLLLDEPAPEGAPVQLEFSQEDELFREQVADWLRANLCGSFEVIRGRGGPGDEHHFVEERKDWERCLAEGGWTCIGWPEEWGGRGASIEQQVIFNEEYARAGGPGRMGHIGETLTGPTLLAFGSDDQKQRFLPDIRSGQSFWCQGYSEPAAGSDLSNIKTRAEWDDEAGVWRFYGQKVWTSLAHESDFIFVLARTDPAERGHRGLGFFLVPLAQEGIDIRPINQLTGTAEFNEVFFDGAACGADDLVGEAGDGWRVAMGLLGFERGVSTLGQQMLFQVELDEVVRLAKLNGAAQQPVLRQRIAEAHIGLRTLRYNSLRMLSGEQDGSLSREAMIYKLAWSSWHRNLGKLAMDVLGPDAELVESGPYELNRLQSLFLFTRADTIYGGTNQIQRNLIAERALGMPREPRGDQ